MADDPSLEMSISSITNPSLRTPLLGDAVSRIRRPPFERTWSVPDQYHSPTFSSKSSSKSSVDKSGSAGTREPGSGIGHQFQALFSGTSFIRNSIESVIGRRHLGKKSTQIAGHVIAGSSNTSMENAGFPRGVSSSSISGGNSKASTNGGVVPGGGGEERAYITQPSSPNTKVKGFLPYFSRSQQFPSLKLQQIANSCRATHHCRKPLVLSTPMLLDQNGPQDRNGPQGRTSAQDRFGAQVRTGPQDRFNPQDQFALQDQIGPYDRTGPQDQDGPPDRTGPQDRTGPRITITTHSNEEFLIEDHISPDAKQTVAQQHVNLGNARSQLLGDDASLYGTPKNEVLPSRERGSTNSAGYYLRDQIISFFQPSDNKLAMKLFGNKNALMKEKMRQKAVGNWVIHPCSNFRLYWDLFMLVLLIANLLILPVAISFFNDDLSTHWIVFNGISDTVFLLDLVINFRTGIIADNFADDIILEPKEIAKHYLRTWFLLDLISSIPLDYIILMLSPDANVTQLIHAGRALRIFRLVKLLSLLRLLRLSRLVRYVNQWEEDIGQFLTVASKFMRIVNLVCLILLLGHWNGCLQWLVPMLQDFPRDSWIALEELQHSDWTEQYTWALFKALSHMLCIGYGRFPPQSTTDVWLTTVSMLTGATCYALFVGHSTTLIQSFDTSRRLYREKFKQVEEYMIYRKLPRKLRQKITDYYEHRYQGKMFDEASILAEVNECLKEEIVNYNCRALVASVPFFTHADPNFVSDIVAKLRHEVYVPGDYIVREGSIGSKMYFIQEGIVDIVTSNGEVATSLSDGSYFGEISLLANAKRVASVRAETYCNLFSLSVDHFHSVLERYPVMRRTMESVAAERLNKIGKNPAMLSNREDLEADITMVNELIRSATPNPSSGSEESESEGEGKRRRKMRRKKRKEEDATLVTAKDVRETLSLKIATVLKRSKSNVNVGDALRADEKTSKA